MPDMVTLSEYEIFLVGGLACAIIGFIAALVKIHNGGK